MPPLKIVVIGPESTGKSTLSAALAASLHTVWIPEYARAFLDGIQRPYEEADLLAIARGQMDLEDRLLPEAGRYLICDTDLYVIKVWSEAKYGRCHRHILEWIAASPCDLYLLTYIDTVWEDDPLREHPLPAERRYFYNQYRDIVMNSGAPWTDIRGAHEERMKQALQAVQALDGPGMNLEGFV